MYRYLTDRHFLLVFIKVLKILGTSEIDDKEVWKGERKSWKFSPSIGNKVMLQLANSISEMIVRFTLQYSYSFSLCDIS